MISILIPVYNYDVSPLVGELHRQCSKSAVPFEIICMDDASTITYSDSFKALPFVDFISLNHNIGRASIRNNLIQAAQFPYLLFLDVDVMPADDDFIDRYIRVKDKAAVIVGGRAYAESKPNDHQLLLHWKYGQAREVKPAIQRNKSPWFGFQTNNFLIQKSITEYVQFDERIKEYGHEDTLFGNALENQQISILHIDNPAIHMGLEKKHVFLEKVETSVHNLVALERHGIEIHARLSQTGQKIIKHRLGNWVDWLLSVCKPLLRANLMSAYPFLMALDLYKLHIYLKAYKIK